MTSQILPRHGSGLLKERHCGFSLETHFGFTKGNKDARM